MTADTKTDTVTSFPRCDLEPRDLDEQIAELQAERRRLRELEHQRATLLPALEKRAQKLKLEMASLKSQLQVVEMAAAEIREGRTTEFRLRKPPMRRAKGEPRDKRGEPAP